MLGDLGGWIVALVFSRLVMSDRCEVCIDICKEGGR